MKSLLIRQHFHHCKYMESKKISNDQEPNRYNQIPHPALKTRKEITKYINWQQLIFGIQGHVTPKSVVWSGQNSNPSKNLWLSWLTASLIRSDQNWRHCRSDKVIYGLFWLSKVTPKWKFLSGRNSNSSKNLWVSWLPASLMKIRSKLNA